jgi:hypothetical protein
MAAGATYTPIANYLLSSAGTITFSSIPQTYTDLRLVINGGTTRASTSDTLTVQFNGDTGTNYSSTYMRGDGSSATSNRYTSSNILFNDGMRMVGTTYGLDSIYSLDIMNYTNTTTYKTVLGRSAGAEQWGTVAAVGLWRSTSAISSIYLAGNTVANFAIGTTFTLYGIQAA